MTVHYRNIQVLATKIYKATNNLSSSLMSNLFKNKNSKYGMRNENALAMDNIRTTRYGLNSISYFGPKIWDLVPNDIKKQLIGGI